MNPLCSDVIAVIQEEDATFDNGLQVLKKGGRPKGSTAEKKNGLKPEICNYASIEALSAKEAAIKDGNIRVNRGAYQLVIKVAGKKNWPWWAHSKTEYNKNVIEAR